MAYTGVVVVIVIKGNVDYSPAGVFFLSFHGQVICVLFYIFVFISPIRLQNYTLWLCRDILPLHR